MLLPVWVRISKSSVSSTVGNALTKLFGQKGGGSSKTGSCNAGSLTKRGCGSSSGKSNKDGTSKSDNSANAAAAGLGAAVDVGAGITHLRCDFRQRKLHTPNPRACCY